MTDHKKEAERIFNENYAIIFEYGEEMSEEIVVSVLAQKLSIKQVDRIIVALESHSWQNRHSIKHYQQVKEAIQNK